VSDETTTTESSDTQASESSQPEVTNNEAAESQAETTSQSDDSEVTEPQTDNSDETETKEWAAKKGVDINDPIALAKLARETEKSFHAKSTEVSELKKVVGAQTPEGVADGTVEADAYPIMNRLRVAEFYNDNPDAKQFDAKMAEIVDEKPWLAQDLDVLLAVAKSESAGEAALKARQDGRKEALDSVAKATAAGAPKATATGKAQPKKGVTEADIEKMTPKEYQELKDSGFNPYTDIV
jgi:hypothetical protein